MAPLGLPAVPIHQPPSRCFWVQGVGGGQAAVGAAGVQRAQHPPGRRATPGAAGPEAAATAGAGDRHLPRAQGALLAVLRSVPVGTKTPLLSLCLSPCLPHCCSCQVSHSHEPHKRGYQAVVALPCPSAVLCSCLCDSYTPSPCWELL